MADLKITVTESVVLNGAERGSTNEKTIGSIGDIYHRIVTVPSGGDTTIASFHSTVATSDQSLDIQLVKYIRITNLDSSNSVNLSFQIDAGEDDTAADESATFLLAAGESFIMGSPHDSVAANDSSASINTTLHDLESIIADSSSNAVKLEIFMASE